MIDSELMALIDDDYDAYIEAFTQFATDFIAEDTE